MPSSAAASTAPDDPGWQAGLPAKITTLGTGWRDEPIPAPSRAELLTTMAGD
jgi:hypothetical protein